MMRRARRGQSLFVHRQCPESSIHPDEHSRSTDGQKRVHLLGRRGGDPSIRHRRMVESALGGVCAPTTLSRASECGCVEREFQSGVHADGEGCVSIPPCHGSKGVPLPCRVLVSCTYSDDEVVVGGAAQTCPRWQKLVNDDKSTRQCSVVSRTRKRRRVTRADIGGCRDVGMLTPTGRHTSKLPTGCCRGELSEKIGGGGTERCER